MRAAQGLGIEIRNLGDPRVIRGARLRGEERLAQQMQD